jgi:hypothetical protein
MFADYKVKSTSTTKRLFITSIILSIVIIIINTIHFIHIYPHSLPFLTKYKMMILSLFSILCAWGGNVLAKHPQYLNHKVAITEENVDKVYNKASISIRILIVIMLSVLLLISSMNYFSML